MLISATGPSGDAEDAYLAGIVAERPAISNRK